MGEGQVPVAIGVGKLTLVGVGTIFQAPKLPPTLTQQLVEHGGGGAVLQYNTIAYIRGFKYFENGWGMRQGTNAPSLKFCFQHAYASKTVGLAFFSHFSTLPSYSV